MGEIIIPFHGGKLVVPQDEAARAWLDKVLAPQAQLDAPRQSPVQIGEYWAGQGGIYVGVIPKEGGGFSHLLASIDEAIDLQYGSYDHSTSGATSKLNGMANTIALLEDSADHPAAKWCVEYTKDGHRDFFLPAQREISLAWATIADKFEKTWYWSSTQYSAYYAWYQYFNDGSQNYASKGNLGRVRAFRRLEFSI